MKGSLPLLVLLFLLPLTVFAAGEPPVHTGIITTVYRSADGTVKRQVTYVNPSTGTKIRLYVIGDSTASPYDAGRFPRMGWAQLLQGFFNPDSVEVVNRALSGRSSKSYYTDPGGWKTVRNALEPGDFLFIQFGHNDQKSDNEELYTEPYSTYKEYLKRYVDTARALGAIPVLLTPIHRNRWSGDQVDDSHGDYPPAMRQLALEEDVPLIDLTLLTESLFESYGKDQVTHDFFMNLASEVYRYYPEGSEDNTHLQDRGAYEVSKLVYRSITQDRSEVLEKLFRSALPAGFIKVYAEDYHMGRVDGLPVAPMDSVVTLNAVEARGYIFDRFTMYGEDISRQTPVEIPVTDSVLVVTAHFETAYRVRISTQPEFRAGYEGSGDHGQGDTVTVVAIPDEGYRFLHWTRNDTLVSTDSVYTFVMPARDVELVIELESVVSAPEKNLDRIVLRTGDHGRTLYIQSPVAMGHIRVFDTGGRMVISRWGGTTIFQLDISGLDNGVYILHADAGGETNTLKFLKHTHGS